MRSARNPLAYRAPRKQHDGPPLVHTVVGQQVRPGVKAVCGTRVLGIDPAPGAPLCTMCESIIADKPHKKGGDDAT